MTLAEKIRELRLKRGWSVLKLSRKSKISDSTIRLYEAGLRCPNVDNLRKLAVAMGKGLGAFQDCDPFRPRIRKKVKVFRELMEELEPGYTTALCWKNPAGWRMRDDPPSLTTT